MLTVIILVQKVCFFFCLHLVNSTHCLYFCRLSLRQSLYMKVKSYEKHPSFLSTLTTPEMRHDWRDHSCTSMANHGFLYQFSQITDWHTHNDFMGRPSLFINFFPLYILCVPPSLFSSTWLLSPDLIFLLVPLFVTSTNYLLSIEMESGDNVKYLLPGKSRKVWTQKRAW